MAAVIAAAWALGVGLLVCVVVAVLGWTVGGHGTAPFSSAVRTGALGFLVGHMAPVTLPGTTFSLLPLGLLALPALLTYRAGRWAARSADVRTLGEVARLTATAATTYAFLALVVSTQAVVGPARVPPLVAVVATLLVSAVGVGVGAVSAARLWPAALAPVPTPVRRGLRAGAVVLATLVVLATAAAVITLALHLSSITALTEQVAPGVAAGAVLGVLSLLYLPTLIVWALAYLGGTGVLLGGAMISPFGGGGSLVPAFPLLGAIPDRAPAFGPLLLLAPVLAGVLGGLSIARSSRSGPASRLPVAETMTAGAVTGLSTVVLAFLGSGSLGAGRLAQVGPSLWAMPLTLTALVLAGLAPTALLGAVLARTRGRPAAVVDLRVRPTLAQPTAPAPIASEQSTAAANPAATAKAATAPRLSMPIEEPADTATPDTPAKPLVPIVPGKVQAFWLPAPADADEPTPSGPAAGQTGPDGADTGVVAPGTPTPARPAPGRSVLSRSVLARSWGRVRPLLHSDGTPDSDEQSGSGRAQGPSGPGPSGGPR